MPTTVAPGLTMAHPAPYPGKRERAHYIDNLRVLLTALVVLHHTAIGYGALGGWSYVTPDTVTGAPLVGMSALLAINQAFFMSLFFFISAWLMPRSLERKGLGLFLKDRLVRLGIPLLLVMFLLEPGLGYLIAQHRGYEVSWTAHLAVWMDKYVTSAHMWFVFSLLVFESAYAVYNRLRRGSISKLFPTRAPGHLQLAAFVVVCGALAFSMRMVYPLGRNLMGLQFGYFVLYGAMYAMGIVAHRKGWIEQINGAVAWVWCALSIALIPPIILILVSVTRSPETGAAYVGGLHWQALLLAYWEAVLCVGISYSLLYWFKRYGNRSSRFLKAAAESCYAVYVFHPFFVVGATILLEQVGIPAFARFLAASTLALAGSFAFAPIIRMVPGVKRVF